MHVWAHAFQIWAAQGSAVVDSDSIHNFFLLRVFLKFPDFPMTLTSRKVEFKTPCKCAVVDLVS